MLDTLFSRLAPHYCLSCGEIGAQICDHCFYDIDLSPRQTCFKCHEILISQCCTHCAELAGVQQCVLAERRDILARLLDDYKFGYKRQASQIVARLLDESAPYFPPGTQLVPIPTSSRHVRRRGFDHTSDITRDLAARRKVSQSPLLVRRHNHAQVGASRAERRRYAESAYSLRVDRLDPEVCYVVCDDIVTTGASMVAAVGKLRAAGARKLVALALLQQPWQ